MPIIKKFTLPSRIKGANIGDVVADMKELHEQLSNIEQAEFESMREPLAKVAARLLEAELLKHNDKAVRLLVSCCLANVLRLFAPDAPYQASELRNIFSLMIQQLKLLADDKNTYQNYLYYLVESLATVKSIVLLLDVDDSDGGRERLLLQLFTLVFDLSPLPNITRQVKQYMLEMLQTIVDECDAVPTELVRLLLVRCGDIRQQTRLAVAEVVRACADKLQPGVGLYFNEHVLHYTSADAKDARKMEVIRTLHTQIAEIGKAAPEVISSVVPQLEEEMQADDMELRIVAISCISQLLLNEELKKLYPSLLPAWMNKINDRQAVVRLHWVKTAVWTLPESSTVLRHQLQTALVEKLQDIDAKVREKTLCTIRRFVDGETPSKNCQLLGSELCAEIGNRCLDKNEDVRLHAIELICLIIRKLHNSNQSGAIFLSAACINATFKLIYTTDRDFRLFYEYYIEHALLMPQEGEKPASHAEFMVSLYGRLNDESKKAFKKWLADKALFVKYFDAYLKLAGRADESRLAPLVQHLASLFRVPLDAQAYLKAMPETILKDHEHREALEALVRPTTSWEKQRRLVKLLTEVNFEEKDARVKAYITVYLVRRASLSSINAGLITAVLDLMAKGGDASQLEAAQRLVGEVISEFPSLGLQHSDVLEQAILNTVGEVNLEGLESYASLLRACGDKINPSEALLTILWRILEEGDLRHVKLATRIILEVAEARQQLLGKVQFMLSQLRAGSHSETSRVWRIISEVQRSPQVAGWLSFDDMVSVTKGMLATIAEGPPQADKPMSLKYQDILEESHVAACLAIKSLRNGILSLRSVDKGEELSQLRILAPQLVEWLAALEGKSDILQYTLSKVLVVLVPRPTATTIIENLSPFAAYWMLCGPQVRTRLTAVVLRKYHTGIIGLTHLSLLVISSLSDDYDGSLKDSLINIRKNDRFVDQLFPSNDGPLDINSRGLHRYEDWIMVTLLVAALHPCFGSLNESVVEKFTSLVELLMDVIVTEANVSYIFDASVQLKRLSLVERHASRNKHMYIFSELIQNTVRQRVNSHKWMLQAVKNPITYTDDLLQEIASMDEINRNLQRSYLSRIGKEKRKSDESLNHGTSTDKTIIMEIEQPEPGTGTATATVHDENVPVDENQCSTASSLGTTPSKRPAVRRSSRRTKLTGE